MPLLEAPSRAALVPSPLAREGGGDGGTSTVVVPPTPNPSPQGGGENTIWQDDAFRRDTWVKADAEAPLTEGPVILPKKRWLAERGALGGRDGPLGLLVAAGETVDDIAGDLSRFALIALDFPKFSDGRAFSTARLLREKHGYAGELRAVGDVLADQIPLMRRVGFTTFEVKNAPTRRALAEDRLAEVTLHYQPAGTVEPPAGTRPWLRRTP